VLARRWSHDISAPHSDITEVGYFSSFACPCSSLFQGRRLEIVGALDQTAALFRSSDSTKAWFDGCDELLRLFCESIDGQLLQHFAKTNRLWIVGPLLTQLEEIVGECAPRLVRHSLLAYFCKQQ
jgi:hypothetical protein